MKDNLCSRCGHNNSEIVYSSDGKLLCRTCINQMIDDEICSDFDEWVRELNYTSNYNTYEERD